MRTVGPALAACLIGAEQAPRPTVDEWRAEAALITACNLAPSALDLLVRGAGSDRELVRRFRDAAFAASARAALAVERALPALRVLQHHHVNFVVIKGPAAADLYPDRTQRPFTDIDILVERSGFRPARQLLLDAGFGLGEVRQPWDWFERCCMDGINLHDDRGGNLDLHHHVAPWIFGNQISFGQIMERATPGALQGEKVLFASLPDSLAISAVHIINDLWKGAPSFLPWKDLIVLSRRLGRAGAADALRTAGLAWFTSYLGDELRKALNVDVFPSNRTATISRSLDLRLRLSGWNAATRVSRHNLGWATRLPVANALLFVAGSAVPSPSYINGLQTTYRQYWKQSWTGLRYQP